MRLQSSSCQGLWDDSFASTSPPCIFSHTFKACVRWSLQECCAPGCKPLACRLPCYGWHGVILASICARRELARELTTVVWPELRQLGIKFFLVSIGPPARAAEFCELTGRYLCELSLLGEVTSTCALT